MKSGERLYQIIAVTYEKYKKIRIFLILNRVDTLETKKSEWFIFSYIICIISKIH